MHGESKPNYAARMAGELNKREVNERWHREHRRDSVEITVVCTCNYRPYPHVVSALTEWERQKHGDPRHWIVVNGKHVFSEVRKWRHALEADIEEAA